MITESDLIELPQLLRDLFEGNLTNLQGCKSHILEFMFAGNAFIINDGYLCEEYYQRFKDEDGVYFEMKSATSLPYFRKVYRIVRNEFLKYESDLFLELHGDY